MPESALAAQTLAQLPGVGGITPFIIIGSLAALLMTWQLLTGYRVIKVKFKVHRYTGVAAFVLVLAACGGDSGTTSPTPGQETPEQADGFTMVTSDDGKLTLSIPPGAIDEDVEIGITTVPLEGLPAELQVVRGAG